VRRGVARVQQRIPKLLILVSVAKHGIVGERRQMIRFFRHVSLDNGFQHSPFSWIHFQAVCLNRADHPSPSPSAFSPCAHYDTLPIVFLSTRVLLCGTYIFRTEQWAILARQPIFRIISVNLYCALLKLRQVKGAQTMTTALMPVLQEVSVTFNLGQVLTWIIIGIIAGILASLLVRGFRYGLVGSLILGLVGAIIGGLLFQVVRIQAIENL